MTNPIHVLGISGSLRKTSFNTGGLRAAVELAPAGMEIEIFDLTPIPLYNADDDTPENLPAAVREFKAKIAAADGMLIATPEYNYSVTGVLKNAIDWASRPPAESPLNRKPLAIMGFGGRFGTVRAQQHLRYITLYNDMKVLNKPELMVPRAWEHFDETGNLTSDSVRQEIRALLESFAAWIEQLRK